MPAKMRIKGKVVLNEKGKTKKEFKSVSEMLRKNQGKKSK